MNTERKLRKLLLLQAHFWPEERAKANPVEAMRAQEKFDRLRKQWGISSQEIEQYKQKHLRPKRHRGDPRWKQSYDAVWLQCEKQFSEIVKDAGLSYRTVRAFMMRQLKLALQECHQRGGMHRSNQFHHIFHGEFILDFSLSFAAQTTKRLEETRRVNHHLRIIDFRKQMPFVSAHLAGRRAANLLNISLPELVPIDEKA